MYFDSDKVYSLRYLIFDLRMERVEIEVGYFPTELAAHAVGYDTERKIYL